MLARTRARTCDPQLKRLRRTLMTGTWKAWPCEVCEPPAARAARPALAAAHACPTCYTRSRTRTVAEAPRHAGRRVQTMAELRGQMDFVTNAAVGAAAATQEKPPDLSCLTSALAPPEAVEEDDTVWDPERLLQTLAQAATADAEANAVAERAVASAAAAAAQTASATTAAVTAVTRRR